MQSYNQIIKENIGKLIDVVEVFREVDIKMELNQVLVFLAIARNEGAEAIEIRESTGLLKQIVSRNILALSPLSYRKDAQGNPLPGHGLIIQKPSPRDARAKELYLTFDGRQLADRITRILMEKKGDGP